MPSLIKCPRCGGELVQKKVEKLLRGGVNFATVTVPAHVCLDCGELLFCLETIRRFEKIRGQLAREELSEFEPLGQSFQAQV